MSTPHADRLRQVFDDAADLSPASRDQFLRGACAGDKALEAEVRALLRSLDSQWSSSMDTAVAALPEQAVGPLGIDPALPATSIGGFQLRRVIGRGAMGVVYEAQQAFPKRLVAIKIMSAWNAGREFRRRFVAEAETLGRLDHPGIARIIAAGTHELSISGGSGGGGGTGEAGKGQLQDLLGAPCSVPWLAMELVEGARTLTAFAHEERLDLDARVEILACVCDAVHAGHLMGVIHRDLKPANVLVNPAGQPKVIDYGVARALGESPERTLHTTAATGASFIGTLAYMSPEQVDGKAQHADVRTDVYALGVMLYELLTGRPPYELDPGSITASARTITEVPPVPPRSVAPSIDKDLETVVLRALRKEPSARYQSAADFAEDLRNVLADRPIRARRPSVVYSLRKWVRRNPTGAALAVLAIIALVVGVLGVTIGFAREADARALADRHARIANLQAADYAIQLGDAATAKARLHAVPQRLRGWEWSYLHARADTSEEAVDLQSLAQPDGRVMFAPAPGLLLAVHRHRVEAFHSNDLQLAWKTPCTPSSSAVQGSRDGSRMLVPGVNESVLLDVSTGQRRATLVHPTPSYAFGGTIDPSGRYAVVAGVRFVGQYEVESGQLIRAWASAGWVYSATTDRAGDRIAWSDADAIVIVDTNTGTELVRVPTSRRSAVEPSFITWSSDERLLACTVDRDVELFDLSKSQQPRRLTGAGRRVTGVAFSADGRHLIAGSEDSTIRIWDSNSGECVRTLLGHEHPVHMTAVGARSDSILTVQSLDSANTLRRWTIDPSRSRDAVATRTGPEGGFISSITPCNDNQTIVIATHGSRLETHNTHTHLSIPCGTEGTLVAAACSANAEVALTLSAAGVLRCVEPADCRVRWSRTVGEPHTACSISFDGARGAIGSLAGTATIVDMSTGADIATFKCGNSELTRMRLTPDGEILVVAAIDGSLQVWSIAARARLREVLSPTPQSIAIFTLSDDGRTLVYAAGGESGEIRSERLLDGSGRQTLAKVGTFIWSLAVSPDGARLAVGGQDRLTRVLEFSSGDELLRLRDHQGSVMTLQWSRDSRTLYSGGYDRRVFVNGVQRAISNNTTHKSVLEEPGAASRE